MPRPGPRPYECVRRAWHSDRHHPVRGSLIQEIFRIVNEVHCPATRKNREWQEKLPIVVLKAEEIMYSKANSEAEYSDLETLWDRVNDAINTIIRRDETSETGDLLQPCIEAALHLGCTPRRSSRSERNDCPRNYLRPQVFENSHNNSNTKVYGNNHTVISSSPLMLPYRQYSVLDPTNPLHHSNLIRNSNHVKKIAVLPKKFSPSVNNRRASEQASAASSSSNTWSVYPLYYNNQILPREPSTSNSHLMQSEKPKNLDFPDNIIVPTSQGHDWNKGHGGECDLTLRLGSSSGSIS